MSTNGVYFDNIHSFYDLDLILSAVEIPPAKAKTNYLDIPGADGSIDLSEALGELKFADRDGAKFTFTMNPAGDLSESAWEAKKTEISNLLNGKRFKVRLDKDPEYYWQGRLSVDEYLSDRRVRQFVVGAKFAPYKLKSIVTKEVVYFCGKNLIDASKRTNVAGGADSVYYENGTVYVKHTGYNSLMTSFAPIPVDPKNRYVFSYDVIGGDRVVISFFDENGRNISKTASTTGLFLEAYSGRYAEVGAGLSINMSHDVAYIQVSLCAMNAVGEGNYNEYSNIQLEIGHAATAFEPYTANAEPQGITLTNARKTVCPTIICAGEVKLNANGGEFVLGNGTHKILDFQLKEGTTAVSVSGTGAVLFVYQEGDL